MTAFTFSVEQLRAAPPEVRRWFAGEIARTLGTVEAGHPAALRHAEQMTLATCTAAEALRVFELIGNDAITTRLFFELAREGALNTALPGLHALRMTDLLHHLGLPNQETLLGGLALIDRAFRQVHGEEAGSLFGYDDAGQIYLHETTQASIRRVWQELVQARAAAEREAEQGVAGFVPPHVGPSEEIAAHAGRPSSGPSRPF